MYGQPLTMKRFRSLLGGGLLLLGLFCSPLVRAAAADMPTAAGSPIAGISFDDRPLMLPVQRNFQMAMLTASSELGRSCGRMEAYGWRLGNSEQQRVNQIFNNTVDRLRAQGYGVETKTANAVSRDVTLFAADRPDKHLIFMWSAGEIGLVMVLCETSPPLSPIPQNALKGAEAIQPAAYPSQLPLSQTQRSPRLGRAASSSQTLGATQLSRTGKPVYADFSPVGDWSGSYTCAQGTTGATLRIDHMKGDTFEGSFSFYPTARNPYVPSGKYAVFGEYDADSMRILINPGKWIERPKDYYNTIVIGSFDPVAKTFSGFFQGILGCTSFEAKFEGVNGATAEAAGKALSAKAKSKASKKKATKPRKAAAKKKASPVAARTVKQAPTPAPLPEGDTPGPSSSPSSSLGGGGAPRASALEPPTIKKKGGADPSLDTLNGIIVGGPEAEPNP